jgi:hypothetical protein
MGATVQSDNSLPPLRAEGMTTDAQDGGRVIRYRNVARGLCASVRRPWSNQTASGVIRFPANPATGEDPHGAMARLPAPM